MQEARIQFRQEITERTAKMRLSKGEVQAARDVASDAVRRLKFTKEAASQVARIKFPNINPLTIHDCDVFLLGHLAKQFVMS